jgi:hypothetical protein
MSPVNAMGFSRNFQRTQCSSSSSSKVYLSSYKAMPIEHIFLEDGDRVACIRVCGNQREYWEVEVKFSMGFLRTCII